MNANELVEKLDAAHGRSWDVYRTAMNRWLVNIKLGDARSHGIDGDTMEEVMLAACEWKDLPLIRRRPRPAPQLTPKRDGSKWSLVTNDGSHWCGNIKTKRDAEECADRFTKRYEAEILDWETTYGAIEATGVEGVDFRYSERGY